MYFFLKKKNHPTSCGCCSSESTNEAIKYIFHFLPLSLLEIRGGSNEICVWFELPRVNILHETRVFFSEAHTPSASRYSLLPPLLPMVCLTTRRMGELFFYLLLPQQPSSFSRCQTDAGVCVFLPFGQWVFHNIESWAFCVSSYKTLSSPTSSPPPFSVPLQALLPTVSSTHCGCLPTVEDMCSTRSSTGKIPYTQFHRIPYTRFPTAFIQSHLLARHHAVKAVPFF